MRKPTPEIKILRWVIAICNFTLSAVLTSPSRARAWIAALARSAAVILVGLSLSSCTIKAIEKPSVLVIMIENLGFSSFSCTDGIDQDSEIGFRSFCEESVRFTHAFTPSTMSQATVASILTGRYPFEHGLRNNGSQALSARLETIAEKAVQQHYRTSFFSGGPPIWRKSGLGQGFETFDDNVIPNLSHLYRPAHELVPLFLRWQGSEPTHAPFMSFLYLADLQFVDDPVTNELGELRESSLESQLDEVRESLGRLVLELKRRKQWDNTYVVLVGLNGASPETKLKEPRPLSLFSDATRVTLMIKPARRGRDGPFNWKIDSNVTLTDVGATLFEILNRPLQPATSSSSELAYSVSLMSVLRGPEPDWAEDRKVISETAWGEWRGESPIRFAVRKGSDLLIQDHRDRLYDTLIDAREQQPISPQDKRMAASREELSDFLYSINPSVWEPPSIALTEKLELARELWRNRTPGVDVLARLRALSAKYPDDAELTGWRAIWALRMADWKELRAISLKLKEANFKEAAVWHFVAEKNLGEKPALPNEACLNFLSKSKAAEWKLSKSCRVDSLANLIEWANDSTEAAAKNRAMEAFIRSYGTRVISDRISEHNWVTGLTWDTNLNRLRAPEMVDLVLALPELRKYRSQVLRRLASGTESGISVTR